MKDYPNEEALRKAHRIYLDAMRPFITRCLKRIQGRTLEDLIRDVSDYESNDDIETLIDVNNIPLLVRNHWYDIFSKEFNSDLNVQNTTWLIVEGRNLWAHPGKEDIDSESTRMHLSLAVRVLGEIKNPRAKEAVETIRDQLFSDEVEEHPVEVENAALKENLAEMSNQLAAMKTEKADCETQLEAEKAEYEELLDTVEKEKIEIEKQLSELKVENADLKKRLETVESESAERIKTLTERLRTVEAGKTRLEERPQNSPIEEWRRKIWKQLCDYTAQKDTPVRFQKPGSAHYLNVSRSLIALTGFNMNVWLGRDNREIAIRLYMSKQNFYTLEKQRKEIEQEFRESLEWEKLPQRRESRISLRKDIIDPTDESDWQNQYEWVISKLEKFHKKFNEVFLSRI